MSRVMNIFRSSHHDHGPWPTVACPTRENDTSIDSATTKGFKMSARSIHTTSRCVCLRSLFKSFNYVCR